VVYHGVDLKTFRPAQKNSLRNQMRAECGLGEQDIAFLFVGDMRKGGRQCIQALTQVPGARLLFVSRSSESPYRALVSELGLSDQVIFAGTSRQVENYYAAADAFVLPSHYDSFGMVVTEAMASALPVIVSREAGASELIRHGMNGLVLNDFRSVDELAGCMRAVADDPAFASRLGLAARTTAEQYSWDVVAERTMNVYHQVWQSHRVKAGWRPTSESTDRGPAEERPICSSSQPTGSRDFRA